LELKTTHSTQKKKGGKTGKGGKGDKKKAAPKKNNNDRFRLVTSSTDHPNGDNLNEVAGVDVSYYG